MPVEKGQIFTPDKKGALVQEIEDELVKLNEALQKKSLGQSALSVVKENRDRLQLLLNVLFEKKGVVTPQETDDVLDALGTAKKSRLESEYYLGIKKSTIYLVGALAVGLAAYIYLKKRAK